MNEPTDISWGELQKAMPAGGLFRGDVPWLLSPRPLVLSKRHRKSLHSLGYVLMKFYEACGHIYRASHAGKISGSVADMLDCGKPEFLRGVVMQDMPRVIRPDLMLREDGGWCLTELDSVPGGQGVTAYLNGIYAAAGWPVLGGAEGMQQGFYQAHPDGARILVSEESGDYLAEMQSFVSQLGVSYSCESAETAHLRANETVYRFFELFDLQNIPQGRELVLEYLEGKRAMSPPPLAYLEEKLWLALFHLPGLRAVWSKYLRGSHLETLTKIIPHSWVVDPAPLPDHAVLPWLNVHDWREVMDMSQKDRRLVLKISGFHPQAWGARGVFIGSDMPSQEWEDAIRHALNSFDESPWLLQDFMPGEIIVHPYYDPATGEVKTMEGRVRVCPYYYRSPENDLLLGGCLATIAPKDKKKIHGMKDAVLVPCV